MVNVLQPCVTWDKVHTFKYYSDRCRELEEGYDPSDRTAAMELVFKGGETIPIGVIYTENRTPYDEVMLKNVEHPLRERGVNPETAEKLFARFK